MAETPDGCTLDNTIALKKKVYTTITQFGNWHRTWALYEEDGVSALLRLFRVS